jgi:hypothetical protein
MPDFAKGFLTGFLLYVIAITVSVLIYLAFGSNNGFDVSATVFLFFIMIGVFRLFTTAYKTIVNRDRSRSAGELVVHVGAMVLLAAAFQVLLPLA